MSNLIPFQFNTSTVRVIIVDDGTVLYVASDVTNVLGYANSSQAIQDHCKHAKILKNILNIEKIYSNEINNLRSSTLFIPESDVNRLIMRSKLPAAEAFQDWLAEEVIPSIRKTGGYSASAFNIPKTLSEALLLAGTLAAEKDEALAKISADKSKVDFALAVRHIDAMNVAAKIAESQEF